MKKLICLATAICLLLTLMMPFASASDPGETTVTNTAADGATTATGSTATTADGTTTATGTATATDGSSSTTAADGTATAATAADGTVQTDSAATTADGTEQPLVIPGADSGTAAATNVGVGITTVTTSSGNESTTVTTNAGTTSSGTTSTGTASSGTAGPIEGGATGSAVASSGNSLYPAEGKTRQTNVILRKSADSGSKKLATFSKKGQTLTVTGEETVDGVLWYAVTSPKGKEGYIQGIYVSVEETDRINAVKKSTAAKKMEVTVEATCADYQGLGKTWTKLYEINGVELAAKNPTVDLAPDVEFSYLTCLVNKNANGIGKETYAPTADDLAKGFSRTQNMIAVSKKGKQIQWSITFTFKPEGSAAAEKAAAAAAATTTTTVKKTNNTSTKKTTSTKKEVVTYTLDAASDKPSEAVVREIDHYEDREMEVTERVQTGTKTYYAYETDEKGKSVLVEKTKPVYTTQTVVRTVSVPVYKDEMPAGSSSSSSSSSTSSTSTSSAAGTAATGTTAGTATGSTAAAESDELEEETVTEEATGTATETAATTTVSTANTTATTAATTTAANTTTAAAETAATAATTAASTTETAATTATAATTTETAATAATTAETTATTAATETTATTAATTDATAATAATAAAAGTKTKEELVAEYSLLFFGPVNNDATGNLRAAQYFSAETQEKFAADYYRAYFGNNNEIHALINPMTQTTAKLSVLGENTLVVVIYRYVNGEESNASTLFTGTMVGAYQIDLTTGEITNMMPAG